MSTDCLHAEILAGALALGEASDAERDAYRRHLAECTPCIEALGGEREIERMANVIAQAHDEERWEPDVRTAFRPRTGVGVQRFVLRFGSVAAAAILFITFGLYQHQLGSQKPAFMHPPIKLVNPTLRDENAVAALGTNPKAQPAVHHAESIAIVPQGTAAFEVRIDEHGKLQQCKITKSTGVTSLDQAICRAALEARTKQSPAR